MATTPDSTELSAQHKILQDINQTLLDRAEITDSLYQANQNILEDIIKAKEEYDDLTKSLAERQIAHEKIVRNEKILNKELSRQGKLTEKIQAFLSKTAATASRVGRSFSLGFKDILSKPFFQKIISGRWGLKAMGRAVKTFGSSALKIGHNLLLVFNPVYRAVNFAFGALKNIGKVMGTVFMQTLKYGSRFVKFMVSLPLKVAGAAAKIGNSLRSDLIKTIGQAVENTKEMFDISEQYGSGAGSAIKSFADSASASMLEFRDITSESVKLFGEGAQGIAARTQAMAQRLGEMGSYADRLGESLRASTDGSAVQFTFMEKSLRILGMTAEDVAYTAQEAVKSGVGINQILMDTQISLKNVAKSSGVNSKLISKNFNVLRKDIINFGHISTEQLQETSAELVKMGLSAQDAANMFNKLDTFESAAQMSAMLSQSFGMNLDALKLIKAENPQEIFEDLRDSMMGTGRSFDDLNRHEKSLMSSTTGMSATALKAMMDFRDMGMSYEEAMQKMKENSPEEKQLKAFNEMTGSLKEIKNIMQDTSFFSAFFKGLRSSIVLASGLGDKFMLVSKRIEDFYTEGLSFGKDKAFMKSIAAGFKPISDTLEALVGDPAKGTKGLFDTAKLSKTVKPFMKKFSDTLGDAFAGKKSLASVRDGFTNMLRTSFSFNTFLTSKDNPAAELFRTGGKLVGQLIKGFAALGPGLVDMFANGFEFLSDYIRGYGGGANSIKKMLKDTFGFSDTDTEAIYGSYEQMLETLFTKVVPVIKDMFFFVNEKVAGLAYDVGMEITGKFFSGLWAGIKSSLGWLVDSVSELFGMGSFFGLGKTEDMKTREAAEKSAAARKMNASQLNEEFYRGYSADNDRGQERRLGELIAVLKQEQIGATGKQLTDLTNALNEINKIGTNWDSNIDYARIDNALQLLGKNTVVLDGSNANDVIEDQIVPTGKTILTKQKNKKIEAKYLNPKDKVTAVMDGGPFDNLVQYAGEAVGSIIDFYSSQFSAIGKGLGMSGNTNQQGSNQPIVIEVSLPVDGKVLAKTAIKADIFGMGKDPAIAQGATVLNDGSTRNQSGGSNEISALG